MSIARVTKIRAASPKSFDDAIQYADLIGGAAFEPKEENPMLGFRGAARYYSPRYRDGFALERRAIRRLRDEMGVRNVIVMIPFCRSTKEADRVLAVMAENAGRRSRGRGRKRLALVGDAVADRPDIERSMRPGRLREIFDDTGNMVVAFDQQDVARPQRRGQATGFAGRERLVAFRRFFQIMGEKASTIQLISPSP